MSSLYTGIPDSYQQSSDEMALPGFFPLVFADDDHDEQHDDEEDEHEEIEDDAEELVEEYEDLIEELGKISNVSDEAVVTDYLTDAITDLKEETKNLIPDKNPRKHLIKTLDHALKRAEKAGEKILDLKEGGANRELDKARESIKKYIDKVEEFSGTKIPATDADLLISKADKILFDSMKDGTDIVEIIVDTPLVVTDQLINRVKADRDALRQIVDALISLGFTVTLDATKNSPTETSIFFSNVLTSQEFNLKIPDDSFSMFVTIAFFEESFNSGKVLTNEEFAGLMNISPLISNNMINSLDNVESVTFSLVAICPSHFTFPECDETFSNIFGPAARFKIGPGAIGIIGSITSIAASIIGKCARNFDDCEHIIRETLLKAFEAGREGYIDLIPTLRVIKKVVNDNGGTTSSENFMISVSFGSPPQVVTFAGVDGDPNTMPTTGGVLVKLSPGPYVVNEDVAFGYTLARSSDCAATIAPGDDKTCTITNDDIIESPPQLFFENFDDGDISDWERFFSCITVGVCPGSGLITNAAGNSPPSPPFWGTVFLDASVTFCLNNLQNGIGKRFTVDSTGDYLVSTTMVAHPCAGCNISARLLVDNQVVLQHTGQNIGAEPFNATKAKLVDSATVNLSAGSHQIDLLMSSNHLCSGRFSASFDDVSVAGPISTPSVSSLASPSGGPYFDVKIDQTSVTVTKPDTVIMPLQVNWSDGYGPEPVSVNVIGLNGTGITHSVSSISDSMFDIAFEIPGDVQTGEYQFLISVRESESDDAVGTSITFNVK